MRINRVALCNFGPYEGLNEFDISGQSEQGHIVLIGGKNGAGKTTLFSAIRLCMYGYREGGYQSPNSYYKKKVKKLINDKVKREDSAESYVEVDFSVVRGTETDVYVIKRAWHLEKTDITEEMLITQNGERLFGDDINDFENYLLSVIPPELFDLYFFDGEKISDFFLEDGSNSRIKNAFLILCGYDNFEIMYRNFKRLGIDSKSDGEVIKRYTEAKERVEQANKIFDKVKAEIEEKQQEISSVKTEIDVLERKYRDTGGVTIEEWNENFVKLKQEEQYREVRNEWIKKAANEIIPFVILKEKLAVLQDVIEKEENAHDRAALADMCEKVLQQVFAKCHVEEAVSQIVHGEIEHVMSSMDSIEVILGLSLEEKRLVNRQLFGLLGLDKTDVLNNRQEVRDSIARSKAIRGMIENSSVNLVQEYFAQKEELLLKQAQLSEALSDLVQYTKNVEIDLELQREIFKRESKLLEEELKKESLNDVTAKALLLLEKLQETLFKTEISKVESLFMEKIRALARKTNFIDSITIDDDFNVHLFKKVVMTPELLENAILKYDEETYIKEYGVYHWNYLLRLFRVKNRNEVLSKLKKINKKMEIVYELDKSTFSNGEKQVYIMTLYWAIMRLSKQEVPFIIDTPFARIDSEHRVNITEKFFNDLAGQVFIFSTNEEIVGQHLQILETNIQAKFLLENLENEKTTVCSNTYFGG